ncbi:MAG: family NAD(P)-dependent oxidoreductase [Ramlibacter sp.]|nr:family NAD(P)-dependent oxidoreductase [Ramlibacter sp.]
MTASKSNRGTAVITGASSGIGAVYADRLARRDYDLVLVARSQERLNGVAMRIAAQTGRRVEVLPADLTAKKDLIALEQRLARDESIRLLVNNAGFNVGTPMSESDPDRLEIMIQLNAVALTRLSRAAAPAFVARGGGTIINIGSIVAVAPQLLNGVYSGSKAFVVSFSEALQHELGAKGLRVQAVLPGATRTDFWDTAGVPVGNLPQESVMSAEDMVDAALVGLDMGELITIPSLPDAGDCERFEATREALAPHLSRSQPAERYRGGAKA